MKAQRCFSSLILFLALATSCFGQRGSNWRVYKAADGLPETAVFSIGYSARGNIWLRHPNIEWISRLNGYEIQAIPAPDQGNSRIYESVSGQIWAFSNGNLWQYKQEKGWAAYDVPEITAAVRRNKIIYPSAVSLCPLRQNHVLLLFPDGLMEFNIENQEHPQAVYLLSATNTSLGNFSRLTLASNNALWITAENGLLKLNGPIRALKSDSAWQEIPLDPKLNLRNLQQPVDDTTGGIVALAEASGTGRQVVAHFDGKNWKFIPLNVEKIFQAWRGSDQTYWAATHTALWQLKKGEKQFVPCEEISPHRYFDFAMETNGIFWLATSDGLFRHAPLTWQSPPGLTDAPTAITAITDDRSDGLWVASSKSLQLFQNNQRSEYPLPGKTSASSTDIRALFVLPNKKVLFEADERLMEFNPLSQQFKALDDDPRRRHKPLGWLKDGTLCVQTMTDDHPGGPLQIYDGMSFQAFPYPQPEAISSNDFQFVFISLNGAPCLCSSEKFFRLKNNTWETIRLPDQTSVSGASQMIEVSDGKFWFGLQGKIMEFDGKNWNLIRSGFENINGLLKTRDGGIWAASDNGLQRYYRANWTANTTLEGLPTEIILQMFEDSHGLLWCGTARGLACYHPEADLDPPHTYVQNLPGPNNSSPEGAMLDVTFSGRDKWKSTPEERLLYSYRIDGQEWSSYQEQRNVTLIDLAAGGHSFRVRAMDRNWNVDPQPALLEFKITAPWYRESRLVFISSLGLAAALFFAGLAFNRHRQLVRSYAEVEAKVALRTRQLELANQELFHSQKMNALGTLAAGIAHDFNNILSIIKGSAQIIDENLDNREKIRTRTDRIKTVVEQGSGIVKAMLGFSRGSEREAALCDVNAIARETVTLLGDRFLREVEVQFEPAEGVLPAVHASKDFIQQILLNLIFNASEAAIGRQPILLKVKATASLPDNLALKPAAAANYVMVSVQDFGTGIAPEVMPRIFEPFFTTKSLSARRGTGLGLSMVYELARQMDCGLSVKSILGQGSTFSLIIPVGNLPVESSPEKR